jgi:hypothetical protein
MLNPTSIGSKMLIPTNSIEREIIVHILTEIRNYGGVAKYIQDCDDTTNVEFVRKFRYVFAQWDKDDVLSKELKGDK